MLSTILGVEDTIVNKQTQSLPGTWLLDPYSVKGITEEGPTTLANVHGGGEERHRSFFITYTRSHWESKPGAIPWKPTLDVVDNSQI